MNNLIEILQEFKSDAISSPPYTGDSIFSVNRAHQAIIDLIPNEEELIEVIGNCYTAREKAVACRKAMLERMV